MLGIRRQRRERLFVTRGLQIGFCLTEIAAGFTFSEGEHEDYVGIL